MRVINLILVALMSIFVDSVLGAACFSEKASGSCLTKARLGTAINTYCKNNWRQTTTNWRPWKGANGAMGQIGHLGVFKSEAACRRLGNHVVDKCYGGPKGGAAEKAGAAINIIWCPFSSQ
ncbi:uncharacterized protein ARB_00658 [Trichophyton benhamiae CBS 112371]|uniref:Secreted protein n=2 Tax=Trichophyton TaxID=5550 RepID=D4AWU2_ARTBC|nr:uncharacterized protein ARB_00658 [Trichophyton benhamiae CBS 112371]XP_003021111.1 uncharacterized protein TRV_04784 [Trichophyton verrucosum HKI 0517]EFE32473.1 hypothetical protein ARB_00658 [Trichophyton benhamiae CBS 112371]EFE40493.1 hypothetical protein TRV_04784 [Trichophyton verrucosum HKI 0517]